MYIVLDTTVLTGDKQFSHSFWRLVGSRPKRWGLRIAVPWAVAQEAIANRRRDFEKVLASLNGALADVGRQGIRVAAPDAVDLLQHEIDGYEEWFTKKLKALRIDILPIPVDFTHAEAVDRAVQRRRPCDDKGDGYRDTLNWISVLRIAENNPDDEVIWVSNDSDFAVSRVPPQLHSELVQDLDEIGAADRVTFCLDDAQARALLIRAHQLDAEFGEWAALQQLVAELVITALTAEPRTLDPVECGLPLSIRTAYALLESASETDPAEVTNLESDNPEQERDLPFTMKFSAKCRMIQYSRVDGKPTFGLTDDGTQEIITRQLIASGSVRVAGGSHGASDVVIDTVAAEADDPVVRHNKDAQRQFIRQAELIQGLLQGSLRDPAAPNFVGTIAAAMGPTQSTIGKLMADQMETPGSGRGDVNPKPPNDLEEPTISTGDDSNQI